MAEIGTPRIAASTSALMYDLERITATGSMAGGPPGAEAAGWPATGDAALAEPLKSAIRHTPSQISPTSLNG